MTENVLKVVSVFIASPGGLEDERRVARRVVEEINQSHSEHWGCQIKLVGWEFTLPGHGRAQSLINRDLDKCEYFIGILWDYWGSKPDDTGGQYTSGFEEEFYRARSRHDRGLIKDIALFFKSISDAQLRDPGESLKNILGFKQKCIAERKLLFKEYEDIRQFKAFARFKLEEIGWSESRSSSETTREQVEGEGSTEVGTMHPAPEDTGGRLIEPSSAAFVEELIKRSSKWEDTSAFEVARFRLIAKSISRNGNDEDYIGNHDVNSLLISSADMEYSDQEIYCLIDSGVAGYSHENVPIWRWVFSTTANSDHIDRIRLLSVFGNSQEKANAIKLVQKLCEGVPRLSPEFGYQEVLREWFSDSSSESEFSASADLLRTNGTLRDAAFLEALLDDIPSKSKDRVVDSILAIRVRHGIDAAFDTLVKYDPSSVSASTVRALFGGPNSLPTETLLRCLPLRSDEVRGEASGILRGRKAIDPGVAESFISDGNPEVRLNALMVLEECGRGLKEDDAEKALVKRKNQGLLSFEFGRRGISDEEYYDLFSIWKLSRLKYAELRRAVDAADVLDWRELVALYTGFSKKSIEEIRTNIEDRYKTYFSDRLKKLAVIAGDGSEIVKKIADMEERLRARLLAETLDGLCMAGTDSDLPLVRSAADQLEYTFSPFVLRYLAKCGSWDDLDRILAFSDRYVRSKASLRLTPYNRTDVLVESVYAVGKNRLADLLSRDLPVTVLRGLLGRLSQRELGGLHNDLIFRCFDHDDSSVRRVMAIRCCRMLSKRRLRRIFAEYLNRDKKIYYNVSHWLDCGVSAPYQVRRSLTELD